MTKNGSEKPKAEQPKAEQVTVSAEKSQELQAQGWTVVAVTKEKGKKVHVLERVAKK